MKRHLFATRKLRKGLVNRRPIPSKWIRLELSDIITDAIKRVQQHVHVHVGEVHCVDELADIADLSPGRFAHRFRKETGEPPWAFVRRIRAEKARKMLESGEKPIDVAFDAGYSDQAHLTREMQARFGKTPGELIREGEASSSEISDNSSSVQDI